MKDLRLKYRTPAPDSSKGWEHESLPIGNGYMGANIFGIVERERIQLTHNALVNPHYDEAGRMFGGLNNLAEVYIHFLHREATEYERGLCLNDAHAYCRYCCDGVQYTREYFASYPDKVHVLRLESSEQRKMNFALMPQIPYLKEYAFTKDDHGGKSGQIKVENDTVFMRGKLHFYNLTFEVQIKVITDGQVTPLPDGLKVQAASWATVLIAGDTNYKLCSEVFLEKNRKKKVMGEDPHEKLKTVLTSASAKGYIRLKQRQAADYQGLFNRVSFSLCEASASKDDFVDDMLERYKKGESVPYLEELYFQYGRYLLISSSRKGGLPANLQGIWNCHDFSPWGSGYWHNINVQMNYWPAFVTNLSETFEPYVDYFQAYLARAQEYASEYIMNHNPSVYDAKEGACGWTIGTSGYPYFITAPGEHSGPGTGALTSKLFWEAYSFSCDMNVLKTVTWPALLGMSKFLTKTVKEYAGRYLVSLSASPEQMNNGPYIDGGTYYQTVGCAFDQQMIYENGQDLLKAAELLGNCEEVQSEIETLEVQRKQLGHYAPIQVGWSGQIKEFDEERFYGEIGEYHHRHISHLMGLYPGSCINAASPAWLDAARVTLEKRGNDTTGWALAHRLNAWARLGEGKSAYKVLRKLLSEKTLMNLWDLHPPFQIDGNFGATAGIAEMLVQSHNDYIEILPALPAEWESGSFEGLLARGGFEISAKWEKGCVKYVTIKSLSGKHAKILCTGTGNESGDIIEFDTVKGKTYTVQNLLEYERVKEVTDLVVNVEQEIWLAWNSDNPVNIYRSVNSEPVYTLIAHDVKTNTYRDNIDFNEFETVTYKIRSVCGEHESRGIYRTLNHATQLELERYRISLAAREKL